MKRFISFVIKQSVAVVLITLLVLGLGVWSTVNMSVNLLPDINVPIICVQTIYPGANASSVEKDVTIKVEDGVGSISGITDIRSHSYDNLSAVILSFDYGTDTSEKKSDISSKLSALNLPDGVSVSVYDLDLNATALATISVTSKEGLDAAYSKSKELAAAFSAIDGVESVSLKGGAEYSYTVKPFIGLELICPLIVQAFSYGALDIPLGEITDNGNNVQIRNNSDIKSVDDILNMPIGLPAELKGMLLGFKEQLIGAGLGEPPYSESMLTFIERMTGMKVSNELLLMILSLDENVTSVKVGEIATVELIPSYNSYAYYSDGEVKLADGEGIVIEVYKANGANSSAVVKEVKKIYSKISLTPGYVATINLLDDQSQFISDSISNVLVSMVIGGVLAILIIFLFLKKVKTSLVIAVTMPLSVLASLICLSLMGITLNMVSLGGLAVGIGMLVDNSIVVIEAISKHRDGGKNAYEAAVAGTSEVGGALFGSTLTTVCVFIPIMFAGGLTAEIFTDLSFAVIFSLAFSLIVAVTVIPSLYCIFESDRFIRRRQVVEGVAEEQLTIDMVSSDIEYNQHSHLTVAESPREESEHKPEKKKSGKLSSFKEPVILNKVTSMYRKVLNKALSYKLVTILVAVAVFGASIGLLFITGTEFLPSIDKGQIEVTMDYGSGRQLETVQSDVLEFTETIARNIENIDYVSASVGKNGLIALTDTGIITVQLTTNKNTKKTVDKIRQLAKAHPTVGNVTVREVDGVVASLMSGASDMSVTIVGSDGDTLKEIAGKIKTKLAEKNFTDITDSSTDKSKQYTLEFDREKIAAFGLDYQTVVMTLRIGIASYTACTVTIEGETYNLNVRFGDGAISDKNDLENFVVGLSGAPVKLKDILKGGAVLEEETEACISRSNGNKMITVSAVLPDTDTGTATDRMKEVAGSVLKEYEGYSFSSSGISSYLTDAFRGLAVALVISFFLLYAVMAVQFSSFVKPLIIMASIPFSFTGGFIALTITRTSLNVVSFIGLIMLMGIIVNNAIVMLEKIKQLKEEGMTHLDAVKEACSVRLRPILMTTLTTVLALIPLAIGIGKGSELMSPLGIVVIGGLLIGTLVTLVLVPAVYCAVHRLSEKQPDGKFKMKK